MDQWCGVMNAYLRPCLPLFVLFALAGCDGIQGDGNASAQCLQDARERGWPTDVRDVALEYSCVPGSI